MPALIIRAALADRPEFQRALVPHFQLRPVKDPYFVPDFIAAPTSLEDITLTCVWTDSETEFVSPDAVLVCIDRYFCFISRSSQ